eukprot:scpid46746/ scgid10201/ 
MVLRKVVTENALSTLSGVPHLSTCKQASLTPGFCFREEHPPQRMQGAIAPMPAHRSQNFLYASKATHDNHNYHICYIQANGAAYQRTGLFLPIGPPNAVQTISSSIHNSRGSQQDSKVSKWEPLL